MTLSATEEYNIGTFRSHVSLRIPYKEKESKRICTSEPFIKPKMSLKQMKLITQKIWTYCTSKKPQNYPQQADFSIGESKKILSGLAGDVCRMFKGPICLEEERNVVLQDYKPRENDVNVPITNNSIETLPQKNNSEPSHIKCRVKKKQKAEIAGAVQFPKSAKVILDPNTANPNLKICMNGRCVRTKTYKEFHSSQSSHENQRNCKHHYNGWTCVQAQEGYSTGSHYWEVDVKGKCDWRLGVVKESAPRNGFINLNTAAGYWTLRLQLGSLMALTEPVTKLNQAPPSKIGVHLDMEAGQVSFYDAVKRKNIYTFNAKFEKGEKIYPVFGTVETDTPLKII